MRWDPASASWLISSRRHSPRSAFGMWLRNFPPAQAVRAGPMRAVLAIAMLLALASAPALAAPSRACLTQSEAVKEYRGKPLKYRQVGSTRCWFAGPTPAKSEFRIVQRAPAQQRPRAAPVVADDLVGLAGTLCAGLCEDLRTVDPQIISGPA